MKNKKLFLKDLSSVTSGFLSTFSGVKNEVDNLIKIKVDNYLNNRGYVTREDFHALEDRFEKLQSEFLILKNKLSKK